MEPRATRVLIVEDDDFFAKYLRLHLLGKGYVVTAIAQTGDDALAAALAEPPDIITIDILLAGDSDGIETAARINALIDVPILYITAHQDQELFERAKITDPSAYLLKPFNERELQLALELALHRHRIAQERERSHESRHEKLFHASPQPMWICDSRSGAFLDVNEAAVTGYGYPREQFLTLSFGDIRVAGSPAKTDAWSGLAMHRRADSTQIVVEGSAHPIEYHGKPAQLMLLLDVTQRLAAEAEVQRVSLLYRTLSARLLSVQEQERQHIARELHDEIGQSLTALKITLQSLGTRPETQPFREQIEIAVGIADGALTQARQMSLDLRPPQLDDLGLAAAIRWNIERQSQLASIPADFRSANVPSQLPEAVAIACYRISQEAITNSVKHAGAKRLAVELRGEGKTLHLEISDDGIGFDPGVLQASGRAGSSMGIIGMRERATLAGGRLEIHSAPGMGCRVVASFPLVE